MLSFSRHSTPYSLTTCTYVVRHTRPTFNFHMTSDHPSARKRRETQTTQTLSSFFSQSSRANVQCTSAHSCSCCDTAPEREVTGSCLQLQLSERRASVLLNDVHCYGKPADLFVDCFDGSTSSNRNYACFHKPCSEAKPYVFQVYSSLDICKPRPRTRVLFNKQKSSYQSTHLTSYAS
jgi:hypothetical protein